MQFSVCLGRDFGELGEKRFELGIFLGVGKANRVANVVEYVQYRTRLEESAQAILDWCQEIELLDHRVNVEAAETFHRLQLRAPTTHPGDTRLFPRRRRPLRLSPGGDTPPAAQLLPQLFQNWGNTRAVRRYCRAAIRDDEWIVLLNFMHDDVDIVNNMA